MTNLLTGWLQGVGGSLRQIWSRKKWEAGGGRGTGGNWLVGDDLERPS